MKKLLTGQDCAIEFLPKEILTKYIYKYLGPQKVKPFEYDITAYHTETITVCKTNNTAIPANAALIFIYMGRVITDLINACPGDNNVETVCFNHFSESQLTEAFQSNLWFEVDEVITACDEFRALVFEALKTFHLDTDLALKAINFIHNIRSIIAESYADYQSTLQSTMA